MVKLETLAAQYHYGFGTRMLEMGPTGLQRNSKDDNGGTTQGMPDVAKTGGGSATRSLAASGVDSLKCQVCHTLRSVDGFTQTQWQKGHGKASLARHLQELPIQRTSTMMALNPSSDRHC